MKKIVSIIGARPQFIKHAPVQLELQKFFNAKTIHTGQHYDENMSAVFFEDLNIPKPDYILELKGVQRQAAQTGLMMQKIEEIFVEEQPDIVLVYGDTNSTLAGVLVASKMNIPTIHVEAGLRSFNRTMPEEVNRIIADEFSEVLFCPTTLAVSNLRKEGITHEHIYRTGDVMYDMLKLILPTVESPRDYAYYFATIHRPYNTDDEKRMAGILDEMQKLNKKVIFAIHPRTKSRLLSFGIDLNNYSNIEFVDPVGYKESISFQAFADAVITDSGGMQKEAYMLQKKCVTLRSETEWVETLAEGWNTLVFDNLHDLAEVITAVPGNYTEHLYGNGNAAVEIVSIIREIYSKK